MKIKNREAVKPLGSHTAVGHLNEFGKWKEIAYLKDNNGMLPPFMIAVGSRARVLKVVEALELRKPRFIDRESSKKMGEHCFGRTSVLVGVAEQDDFQFPLAVFETQMGCPATQIVAREIMYFSRDNGYETEGGYVKSDGLYIVRAGTCAGVNSHDKAEHRIGIGDILLAGESYGSVGALVQSVLGEINFTGVSIGKRVDKTRKFLEEHRNLRLSHDRMNLSTRSSCRLLLHLQKAAAQLGLDSLTGANFTKDSLYAEMGEEGFAMLRDRYGVVSTEMEQLALDVLAAEFTAAGIPAHSGLVSAAIGAIPGKSFPETPEEKKAASDAEENALKVAAAALGSVAKSMNS
ncbi:hypothetical protein GF318_02495 [Candidatus Micrarchaeota archaeon]|nr:hypothetical protein [Candidatus Micrarchaeota archaeon]